MMRSFLFLACSLVMLGAGAVSVHAQDAPASGEPAASAPAAAALAEPAPGYAAQAQFTGQAAAGAPRTLRAHWHVYLAFATTWLLLFGYAISVGRRARRIEDELRSLKA